LQGCVFFALNRGQSAKIGLIWVGGADRNRTGVAPFIVHSECRSERQINWLNFPSFFGMARDRLSFGVGSSSRSCELDSPEPTERVAFSKVGGLVSPSPRHQR